MCCSLANRNHDFPASLLALPIVSSTKILKSFPCVHLHAGIERERKRRTRRANMPRCVYTHIQHQPERHCCCCCCCLPLETVSTTYYIQFSRIFIFSGATHLFKLTSLNSQRIISSWLVMRPVINIYTLTAFKTGYTTRVSLYDIHPALYIYIIATS